MGETLTHMSEIRSLWWWSESMGGSWTFGEYFQLVANITHYPPWFDSSGSSMGIYLGRLGRWWSPLESRGWCLPCQREKDEKDNQKRCPSRWMREKSFFRGPGVLRVVPHLRGWWCISHLQSPKERPEPWQTHCYEFELQSPQIRIMKSSLPGPQSGILYQNRVITVEIS